MRHLITSLFAIAVLLATAGELRRDFAALYGTRAASGRLGHLLKMAGTSSFVSGAFDRVRWDGTQNVLDWLSVNSGRQ